MAASESYLHGLDVDTVATAPDTSGWANRAQFLQIYAACTLFADWITCSGTLLFLGLVHSHTAATQDYATHSMSVLAIAGGALAAFLVCQQQPPAGPRFLSGIRETENILRAVIPSLSIVLFIDLSLRLHAFGWQCFVGLIVIPALLRAERHAVIRIAQQFFKHGHGLLRAALYICESECETAVADPATLLMSGITVVVTIGHVDVSMAAPDLSTNRPSELTAKAETINRALLSATRSEVLLVGGFRFISEEVVRTIESLSVQTGIPVAFIEGGDAPSLYPLASQLHAFQLVPSIERLHESRFISMQQILDTTAAGCLLFLLGPVFLIIALAVRLDSPGPSFFIQERVGKHGVRFQIFKFRSMFVTAPHYAASPTRSSDPRITRVGRVLRRLGLDELPQLMNVLKGEMAFVGPRPEMPFLVERHRALHRQRLRVKPGITGLWQLSPDRKSPIHENLHHDLYYVANGNLFLDLAILIHTLFRAVPGGI